MHKRNELLAKTNPQMVVNDPWLLSENARSIMTRYHPNTDLISLSKSLPNSDILPQSTLRSNAATAKNTSHQSVKWQPTLLEKEASNAVSTVIHRLIPSSSTNTEIPLVGKGLLNGTFKIAFDSATDANSFRNFLKADRIETSYFGNGEKFPIVHAGKSLNHRVRFENNGDKTEIPEAALDFLKVKFNDNDKVSDIVEKMVLKDLN